MDAPACSCLSANLSTAWAEVNTQSGSVRLRASSVVSVVSAVQATASLWMRILCQHSSNGTWLLCLSLWLHFRMNAASLPHQTDWPPSWTNSLAPGWVGGGKLAGWGTWSLLPPHTLEARWLREKTAQERWKTGMYERDGAARGKERRLRRTAGEMAAVGALEIAWLITAAARPCVVMASSETERESSQLGSGSQRVKDSSVFKPSEEHFKRQTRSCCLFKRRPALQEGWQETLWLHLE